MQAFDDVMHDMVFKSKPMDRVVLGDVGFGKTEVAIRAMHRAVVNHRQVQGTRLKQTNNKKKHAMGGACIK
jgi:transcription-repair coupling factor (superfamily II helicase)